jgi:NADH-quinone oxidoreductase subunit C
MNASSLVEAVRNRFPQGVRSSHTFRGDATVVLEPAVIIEAAQYVKQDAALRMNMLVDLTAVDYLTFGKRPVPGFFTPSGVSVRPSAEIPDEDPWPGPPENCRFTVVYHFYSTTLKHRLRFVVPLEETDPEVDSVTTLWAGANWFEREVWDMFGIRFRGHPDLRRLLMYDEFEGYPLRKDYPVKKRQPLVGPRE